MPSSMDTMGKRADEAGEVFRPCPRCRATCPRPPSRTCRPCRTRSPRNRAPAPRRRRACSPRLSIAFMMKLSASSADLRLGAKPPSSPTLVPWPASFSALRSVWNTSAPMRMASAHVGAAHRHDHEFLDVDRVVGVRAAVDDVHHRHGQHVRAGAAEIAVERQVRWLQPPPWRRPATRRGWHWRRAGPCWACRRA